jgi:hypothetical protein
VPSQRQESFIILPLGVRFAGAERDSGRDFGIISGGPQGPILEAQWDR